MTTDAILLLDVGNSHIFAGVSIDNDIVCRFRYDTKSAVSSDQLGVFLRSVLRENDISHKDIASVAICSVVPQLDYSLRAAIVKYFSLEPFILQAGVKTGLKINVNNPQEVGSDQIAGCIAAEHEFPRCDKIIVDFGTATTICALSAKAEYLGVSILPGVRASMEALFQNAAKLPVVEIKKPGRVLGKHTVECIQSGIYYGNLAAVKSLIDQVGREVFKAKPIVIASGGFSQLFADESLYDHRREDLVLEGLRLAILKCL